MGLTLRERIGLICEGQRDFEDQKVLTRLVARIVGHNSIVCLPQGSKPTLLERCGKVARQLIDTDRCNRVLIFWDLESAFSSSNACRRNDRHRAIRSLAEAGLDGHPCIFLVCVERELETWMLADGDAISKALHRPPRKPPRIADSPSEHESNPKGRLRCIFKARKVFDPKTDNVRIVEALPLVAYGSSVDRTGEDYDATTLPRGIHKGDTPCSFRGDKQGGAPLVRNMHFGRTVSTVLAPARPA